MNALILPNRQLFLVDTHVNLDPTAEQLAEITQMAAEVVRRFGLDPESGAAVAFEFRHARQCVGTEDAAHAGAAARAGTELEVDGEMHGDSRAR